MEPGNRVFGLADSIVHALRGRVFQARTNAPPWRCVECGAANHAATIDCCRGCGDRDLLEAYEPRDPHSTAAWPGTAHHGV